MKSIRLYGPGDLRITEEDMPVYSGREMLVKISYAAVCGTDVRSWTYGKDFIDEKHPMTLGHEVCGTVAETGKHVTGFRPGDRIAIVPCYGCGTCSLCTSGNSHQCSELRAAGINCGGMMSEYIVINEKMIAQGNVFAAPDGLDDIEMTLNEPLSCVYNGFLKLDVQAGDTGLVIGAGPIGVMHAQLLHTAGVKVLIAEKLEERRKLVKSIAPYVHVYDPGCGSLNDFVMSETDGNGLDIGITACPDPQAQKDILPLMGMNGRVHFFGGVPASMQPVALDTNIIHYRALKIVGTTCSNVWEYRKTLEFVRRGDINLKDMATAVYDACDAVSAFENARECRGLKNLIKFGG